jgi:hypothetical protein
VTINDLLRRLEEYRDDLGGDVEVRLMTQENWPFENTVIGLASGAEINDAGDDGNDEGNDDDECDDERVENDAVVYIVEGEQLGYGTKRAWEAAY